MEGKERKEAGREKGDTYKGRWMGRGGCEGRGAGKRGEGGRAGDGFGASRGGDWRGIFWETSRGSECSGRKRLGQGLGGAPRGMDRVAGDPGRERGEEWF